MGDKELAKQIRELKKEVLNLNYQTGEELLEKEDMKRIGEAYDVFCFSINFIMGTQLNQTCPSWFHWDVTRFNISCVKS